MRLLVTGATGFIGQHLIPLLLHHGHQVTALVRKENRAKNYDWHRQIRLQTHDILDPTATIHPEIGNNDAVIHLAWAGLPNYMSLFHFERNLPADYRFLKAVIEAGIKQVLVTGTCLEYGMQSGCLSEDLPTRPANPYALAKDTLREFLESLQREVPFNLQWARLFYMHGPGQHPSSILAQLDTALERGDDSFNMSGGEQLRDYLPIREVVRRLLILAENPQCRGIVNICRGTPISVRGLVEQHLVERGRTIRMNMGHFPYPENEPMAFWGDCTKLQSYPDKK